MKIEYHTYKPGYEEDQARIYTKATGIKATAEEIRLRYKEDKTDPKFIRFAFMNGKIVAYCQARVDKKDSIAIGYPWAFPECPPEAQNKLFDDLMSYIKKRKQPKDFHYWIRHDWEHVKQFFKQKGFILEKEGLIYDIDVTEASKIENNNSLFTSRIATKNDLNLLVEIARADKLLKTFMTKEVMIDYFTNKVLADGHAILVFKEGKIVCASAPLREYPGQEEKDHMILRFTATRNGYEEAWKTLIIEIAKECVASGPEWTQNPLRVNVESGSKQASILSTMNPKTKPSYDYYVLRK
ncbi:MAG: hypothetical protein ACFFAU_03220 [Candidatus Hodarchaeota archaeon]